MLNIPIHTSSQTVQLSNDISFITVDCQILIQHAKGASTVLGLAL